MGELIFIIFTILIIIGFLVYHYLNRDSSATLSDDYSQARKMSYGGIAPRYWRSLDASFIEKKFNVSERARNQGANNYPSDAEVQGGLSRVEGEIYRDIETHYQSELNRIDDFYMLGSNKKLENEFRDLRVTIDGNGYEQTFQRMKGRWSNAKAEFIQKVSNAIRDRKKAYHDLRDFRLNNNVKHGRNPMLTSKIGNFFKILVPVILFYIEYRLNFNALNSSPFIEEGDAIYIASIVASINVVLSFLVGFLVLTHLINPVEATKKPRLLFYGPILAIYGFVIVYVNVMMGVFRSYMTTLLKQPAEERQQYFNDAFTNSTWPFDNLDAIIFDGALLLFLGGFFALITMVDAYFFRDPIPGYSEVGDKAAAIDKRIQKLTDIDKAFFVAQHKIHEDNLLSKHEARLNALSSWSNLVDATQKIKELFNNFNKSIKTALKTSIENFRTENKTFRTVPVPKYFTEEVKAEFIQSFDEVYVAVVDEHMNDKELRIKFTQDKRIIEQDYATMINKYSVFFEKETEELNEIVRNLNNENIED